MKSKRGTDLFSHLITIKLHKFHRILLSDTLEYLSLQNTVQISS